VADSPRLPVRFDAEAFGEDLAHASRAGRALGERERARLETTGIALAELRACESEGRDGTRLAGCVKTYLPAPDGQWAWCSVASARRRDRRRCCVWHSGDAIRRRRGSRASTRSPIAGCTRRPPAADPRGRGAYPRRPASPDAHRPAAL
jgi:hypothetical protein